MVNNIIIGNDIAGVTTAEKTRKIDTFAGEEYAH